MKIEFKCPHCNEMQTTIRRWEQTSIGYEFDFEKNDFTSDKKMSDYSEFELYACTNCGEELSKDNLPKNVQELLKDNLL